MILFEFEGKNLLKDVGIKIPNSQLLASEDDKLELAPPLVLKAQVLSGKRAEAGGIIKIEKAEEVDAEIKNLFGKVINNETVEKILAEEMLNFEEEYYLSISYDTNTRGPVLAISKQGGTGIEERGGQTFPIDPLNKELVIPSEVEESLGSNTESGDLSLIVRDDIVKKLIQLFFDQDCLLLEINPLIKVEEDWVALDAKIKLDDNALGRHENWQFSARSAPGHTPTKREIAAKKIDEADYRGVAGSAFFDLPEGDIAVMASGGGASLMAMDTLIKLGGKPANYTEYGGNPPREKVFKLTQIVLDKPDLHGLWVVGALANFTDIFETLSGFIEGLREAEKSLGKKFDFPIVIRRAGPRDAEAREMLKQVTDFDIHIFGEETSIAESAKVMVDLAEKYAQRT